MNNTSNNSILRRILCLLCCLFLAGMVVAQSGRRAKPAPSPYPTPTPEPTPIPAKPTEKLKPLTFIVGMDRGTFSSVSLNVMGGVVNSCAQRLNEPATTKAEVAERDMDRSTAIKRAKAETEAYVVWLKIFPDNFDAASAGFNEIYIEYTVFAPVTGKQVTTGHTYPDKYRRSTVILKPPTVSGDRAFNEAARDAADKILDHFHVGVIRP